MFVAHEKHGALFAQLNAESVALLSFGFGRFFLFQLFCVSIPLVYGPVYAMQFIHFA